MFWLFVAGAVIFAIILAIYRKIIYPAKKAVRHIQFAENMVLSVMEKDAPGSMVYFISNIQPQFERFAMSMLRKKYSFLLEQDPYFSVMSLNNWLQSRLDLIPVPKKDDLVIAVCSLRAYMILESHSNLLSDGRIRMRRFLEKYPELKKDFSFYLDNIEKSITNLPF